MLLKSCVAIGHFIRFNRSQRGWYAILKEEVSQGLPCARGKYLHVCLISFIWGQGTGLGFHTGEYGFILLNKLESYLKHHYDYSLW